jgi:hypothetical protein
MFASVNLAELAALARSVITQDVISGSKVWKLDAHARRAIRVAMFGRAKPACDVAGASAQEQSEVLSEFTSTVAGPLITRLPPDTAALAVLMLYEEFVKAVFIQPLSEDELGGEG